MSLLEKHFEVIWETLVLSVIYLAGAIFLAKYGEPMQLGMWLTGGVVVGALVRAFQPPDKRNANGNQEPPKPEQPKEQP